MAADDGPSLADHVRRSADVDQVLELLRQRSVYQLKEADPTTWVVPRLPVRAKAALMELQFDEYGNGDPNRLHAHLFARGMESVGLRSEYGAYVDDALPATLELNNALTMFGHAAPPAGCRDGPPRRLRDDQLPAGAQDRARGSRRLGLDGAMVAYYDEHVEADAVHEQLAAHDICGTLAEDEPDQVDADPVRRVHLPRPRGAGRDRAVRRPGAWRDERAAGLRPPGRRARAARADARARCLVRPGRRGHASTASSARSSRCAAATSRAGCRGATARTRSSRVASRRTSPHARGCGGATGRARAALAPAAPCTPPPGCADAEPR